MNSLELVKHLEELLRRNVDRDAKEALGYDNSQIEALRSYRKNRVSVMSNVGLIMQRVAQAIQLTQREEDESWRMFLATFQPVILETLLSQEEVEKLAKYREQNRTAAPVVYNPNADDKRETGVQREVREALDALALQMFLLQKYLQCEEMRNNLKRAYGFLGSMDLPLFLMDPHGDAKRAFTSGDSSNEEKKEKELEILFEDDDEEEDSDEDGEEKISDEIVTLI